VRELRNATLALDTATEPSRASRPSGADTSDIPPALESETPRSARMGSKDGLFVTGHSNTIRDDGARVSDECSATCTHAKKQE